LAQITMNAAMGAFKSSSMALSCIRGWSFLDWCEILKIYADVVFEGGLTFKW